MLIGDDELGWHDEGVFNIEAGCYAKCIKLSKENEPFIYNAIKFGSVLENVVYDSNTRDVNYDDNSITENTRTAYPVSYIPNAILSGVGAIPKNIILLTCNKKKKKLFFYFLFYFYFFIFYFLKFLFFYYYFIIILFSFIYFIR